MPESHRLYFLPPILAALFLPSPHPVSAEISAVTLSTQAEAIDAPSIGPELDLTEPIPLPFGLLTPEPGARAYQLLAGDEPCGLYLHGASTLRYEVRDRFSIPVAERNVRRATPLDPRMEGEILVLEERLEDALIWSFEVSARPSGNAPAADVEFPDWARKYFDNPLFERPSIGLLTGRGLGVSGVVYGLFKGKRVPLLLDRDPIGEGAESLYRLEKTDTVHPVLKNRFYSQRLASQPIGRQWWERFPGVLVAVDESISVDNPGGKDVVVTSTFELRAAQPDVRLWRTNLVSDLVFASKGAAAYLTSKEHPIRVSSVHVDGQLADFLHRDDKLLVALPRTLAAGETVKVTVVNEGEMALRAQGDSFWSLGTWPWYPQPELNSELATVELEVRVPKPFTPFASGEIVSRDEDDDYATLVTRLDKPMQFPVVAAGRYHIYSDTQDGITCHVATYATGREKAARRLINNFFASAKYYHEAFDVPYPFKEFTMVEVNAWGFGQAPPGFIFITKEAFNSHATDLGRLYSQELNARFVHEVAHAWWGHVIKMDSLEEQWLTESFASYSSALCLQAMYGGKKGEKAFRNLMKKWRGRTVDIGDGGSIYLANFLAYEGLRDAYARSDLLYSKGPVVLHALRQQLAEDYGSEQQGDRYFLSLLRSFLKNFPFQWGQTRYLVGILNQMTGKDWQPWFEKYVYGTEMPEVEL